MTYPFNQEKKGKPQSDLTAIFISHDDRKKIWLEYDIEELERNFPELKETQSRKDFLQKINNSICKVLVQLKP